MGLIIFKINTIEKCINLNKIIVYNDFKISLIKKKNNNF